MFVIEVTYVCPLEMVEPYIEGHRQFLDENYKNGNFVMSGVKVPRDGGIIIANGDDKAVIEQIVAQDPFAQHKLARYDITQFDASKHKIENFTA